MFKWKHILHVFNTWVLANLLHPFFLILVLGKMDGEWFNDGYIGLYFFGLMYSFVFSFPLLILASVLFILVFKTKISPSAKFGSWTFFAMMLPITVLLILNIVSGNSEIWLEEIEIFLPSSVAVLISISIRYKQFYNCVQPDIIKENDNG